jgi:hypothetical protein
MAVMSAAEFVLQWVGIRRVVAKVGHKWGNFGNTGTDRISIGALQMRIVLQRHEQTKRAYNGCRFRGQKGNSE